MSLVEVHLLHLPVATWARAQEQTQALQREFALAASEPHGVPARLLELMAQLHDRFGDGTSEAEETLLDASDQGVDVLPDLVYRLPAEAGPAALDLGRMLDEADDHCRTGDHLLTLAADEELVRFRWWYLDQVAGQCAGAAPVAWPDYRRA